MKKYSCVECGKSIRSNSKSNYIHRSCWLSLRQKDERYLDFLFCKDREKQKKVVSFKTIDNIPPIVEEEEEQEEDHIDQAIDEIKELVNEAKPPNYEADKSVVYQVDIAGNVIHI